jgi:flagellar protein FliO/FliZ
MQMLDRLPLGQDKAVAIVRMGSHYYLIGIASSQITLLAEVSEDDINMEMNESSLPAGGEGYPDFKKLLKKYTDRNRKDE